MTEKSTMKKINLMIVDDSRFMQEMLSEIFLSSNEFEVISVVSDGEQALQSIKEKKPDVITMDIHMPKMGGVEATRKIMETNPIPIVIVCGSSEKDMVQGTLLALEAGALAVIKKPPGAGHPDHEATVKELIQMVKLMSEVKVVRRWSQIRREMVTRVVPNSVQEIPSFEDEIRIIAIGASTGGPIVLQSILSQLPKEFPIPIVAVQHISHGFVGGLADWLDRVTNLKVRIAKEEENLLPGYVYLAPDGFQMKMDKNETIVLSKDGVCEGHCPSVSVLFRSVAEVFGKHALGILLTGMGKDGAQGLRIMKEKGAVTIAQDKESSVVFGMPGEAVNLDAACYVFSPTRIAEVILRASGHKF